MLYPIFATLAFALLLAGFTFRTKAVRLHAALMSAGMFLDIAIVLTIELNKNAVDTVMKNDLSHFQRVHVASSTLAVLLYVPIFILGCILLFQPSAANASLKNWHVRLGYVALVARLVGFGFMFFMLGR